MAWCEFMAFLKVQARKVLRQYLGIIAFLPFLIFCVVFAWRQTPLRYFWFFQFLYLVIVASALTSGLYYDDTRSRNMDLVLSRGISATRLVFARFSAAFLISLLVPLAAFVTAIVALRQSASEALQFTLVSIMSLGFWTAAFCFLSGIVQPRFNWMVVLGVYLSIPRWLAFDSAYSPAQAIASANGFTAFMSLFRWQMLDFTSLLWSLAATGCLLAGQVIMVNKRWIRA